jgi:hypothetical protein
MALQGAPYIYAISRLSVSGIYYLRGKLFNSEGLNLIITIILEQINSFLWRS